MSDLFCRVEEGKPYPRGLQPGDTVRLYAFPGVFVIGEPFIASAGYNGIYVRRPTGRHCDGFPISPRSVVEINGRPVPLMSCPIDKPAADYPHTPQFDYDDGPQERAAEVLEAWRQAHPAGSCEHCPASGGGCIVCA